MDRPPVLLVHGTGSSFDHNWASQGWVDLLDDQGVAALPCHLPGHGPGSTSDVPGLERARGDSGESVLEAARQATGPVDAVGFSAGGLAVLNAVTRAPELFRRIVLIGVGDAAAGLSDNSAGAGPSPRQAEIAAALTGEQEPTSVTGRIFRRLVRSAGNDPVAVAAFVGSRQPRPTAAQLAAVPHPVLVVLGDEDFAGPGTRLTEILPHAVATTIRGADHFSTPGNFSCIDAVLDFLVA